MDFFEEDDPPSSPASRRRPPRERFGSGESDDFEEVSARPRMSSEQRMKRGRLRLLGALAVGLLLLFLLANAYFDGRKKRGFENYVRDLSGLTAETEQLSKNFFSALGGGESSADAAADEAGGNDGAGGSGGGSSALAAESDVNSTRGTAQGLVNRAQNLDAPDELSGAQSQIVLAYTLRSEAIDTVAEQLPDAQGRVGAKKATREIAEQMGVLLASDVLYSRARREIENELAEQEVFVEGDVPESQFLPSGRNDPNYLSEDEIASLIGGTSSGGTTGPAEDGLVHGLGLVSTTIGGTTLSADAATTVSADAAEIEVAVMNQGEATENGVQVSVSGGVSGNQRIGTIEPGATEMVALALTPAPTAGETVTIDVEVDTVDGEQVAENNSESYEVVFE
ncbi:MAG: CARDB domain-containing protein [Solirubrobacterales bacterium]